MCHLFILIINIKYYSGYHIIPYVYSSTFNDNNWQQRKHLFYSPQSKQWNVELIPYYNETNKTELQNELNNVFYGKKMKLLSVFVRCFVAVIFSTQIILICIKPLPEIIITVNINILTYCTLYKN